MTSGYALWWPVELDMHKASEAQTCMWHWFSDRPFIHNSSSSNQLRLLQKAYHIIVGNFFFCLDGQQYSRV